jgi:hypothetical protein
VAVSRFARTRALSKTEALGFCKGPKFHAQRFGGRQGCETAPAFVRTVSNLSSGEIHPIPLCSFNLKLTVNG